MATDPQTRDEHCSAEPGVPQDSVGQLPESLEHESFRVTTDKARRLVAAELDLAETRASLFESNLKITEAQLELAERQIDQLSSENERLRRENEALKIRLGEPA